MLWGPATDRLSEVLAATGRPVIASGGVASLDDLRALAALEPNGLEGAIVGKALYAGRFTVTDALTTLAEATPGTSAPGTSAPGTPDPHPPVPGPPDREGSPTPEGTAAAVHTPREGTAPAVHTPPGDRTHGGRS
jgi:hypothetical protein